MIIGGKAVFEEVDTPFCCASRLAKMRTIACRHRPSSVTIIIDVSHAKRQTEVSDALPFSVGGLKKHRPFRRDYLPLSDAGVEFGSTHVRLALAEMKRLS